MASQRICCIENCGKVHYGRGWCRKHYRRWAKHGDPLAGGTFYGEPARFLQETVLPYNGDECLIWPFGRDARGYGHIWVDGAHQRVPRIVCEAVNGPPPSSEYYATHSCGKGHLGCVAKRHLVWKTQLGNMADTLVHGTRTRGSRIGTSKLTADEVRSIRSLQGIMTITEIAKIFGIDNSNVSRIHTRQLWGWLDDDTHVPPVGSPHYHEGKAA